MKYANIINHCVSGDGTHDTRTYRYVYDGVVLKRARICYLDTTAILNSNAWELVLDRRCNNV